MVSDPLGFILKEHRDQERICSKLEQLAKDLTKPHTPESAATVMAYLTEELPAHEADEEHLLFPLLQARCRTVDVGTMLNRLRAEHEQDRRLIETLVDDLAAISAEVQLGLPTEFTINALMLAERWRRHLAWENQTVLPLAGEWLDSADLTELGQAMVARRTIEEKDGSAHDPIETRVT